MNKRIDGTESKLQVHVDAVGSGGGIYKSTAGVMEHQPDVYAQTLIVFQDVSSAPAPYWISVPR